jgi:hypothetical protein
MYQNGEFGRLKMLIAIPVTSMKKGTEVPLGCGQSISYFSAGLFWRLNLRETL